MKIKTNKCFIDKFECLSYDGNECIYAIIEKEWCKYSKNSYCTSKMAQVNRMILTLKEQDIKIKEKTE